MATKMDEILAPNPVAATCSWPVGGRLLRRGGRVPAYRKAGGRWISGARPLPRTGIPAENTRYEAARVFIAGGRCPALGTDGIGAGASARPGRFRGCRPDTAGAVRPQRGISHRAA